MAAAAIIPLEKHEVFLSFRGEDTRKTFTSHLYEALCRCKIRAYIDNELERGDDIAPALLEAISESKLSVIIFSENHASSTWCLDELVHILRCRDSQFVIPIFYGVDPSDVRKLSRSYADAFIEHEKRFEDYKLEAWREALTTAANISGFDSNSKTISSDAELVKLVVDDVLAKLNRKSQIASGLEGKVGLEKHVRKVESLLCLDSNDVRTVGIWGMGGIGKSTIADVVYHRLSSQFEACCFVPNVREASETRQGLHELRNQLVRTLLKEENLHIDTPSIGSTFVGRRLSGTKALVVLDDVSDLDQVDFLVGVDGSRFGAGSRIIVTARNKRVIGVGDEKVYKVEVLDCDEALDLFHLRALRNLSPTMDYTCLSREVVDYAGGNPLALTALGSVFSHCKSKEDWKGELDKLKKYPDKQIQNVLRFSYDGLGKNEEDIFLNIACFHKGKDIDEANKILEACGFSASAGVRLLTDMSLISVDEEGSLQMHDLIQEMGRQIVREQCDKNSGIRSRLWFDNEICGVLRNNREGAEYTLKLKLEKELETYDGHQELETYDGHQEAAKIFTFWIYCGLKRIRRNFKQLKEKYHKDKEKYYKDNGGFSLQQKLQTFEGTAARIFSIKELKKATKNFDDTQKIGEGGYGFVHKGTLPGNKEIAVKMSKSDAAMTQSNQFINEVLVLSQISHRNVVRLLGCCLETKTPLLVYEFVSNGTLYEHIHKKNGKGPLSFGLRMKIAAETAGSLAYLHYDAPMQIVHRDVKATNILLDELFRAKVSDFGASKLVPEDENELPTLVRGTLGYLDPEYLQSNTLTEKSDVYSFGVVLVELITSQVAISHQRPEAERNLANSFLMSVEDNNLAQILDHEIIKERSFEIAERVTHLAKRCLSLKGRDRPTMKVVVIELEVILAVMAQHPGGKPDSSPKETDYLLAPSPSNAYNADVRGDEGEFITSIDYDQSMQIESIPDDEAL